MMHGTHINTLQYDARYTQRHINTMHFHLLLYFRLCTILFLDDGHSFKKRSEVRFGIHVKPQFFQPIFTAVKLYPLNIKFNVNLSTSGNETCIPRDKPYPPCAHSCTSMPRIRRVCSGLPTP